MKSDRLLSALILLQARGRLSTRDIAARLEVSERTAYRDMEALCAAGIPLIAYRGAQGGWELQKGWRTQVPGLDDAELQALLMAQPSALGDRKLSSAAQRAFDKLLASLPAAMKLQAESIRARLHIDPAGWRPSMNDDLSMLPTVQAALAQDCKLTFFYTRADGETGTRTVDPLGIVCKQTAWYLIARAPAGVRTYRVSRMSDVVMLALPFERPAAFDLDEYWRRSVSALQGQKQPVSIRMALSSDGVMLINRWCPMTPATDCSTRASLSDGWVEFDVEFENDKQARFVVLGLGSRAIALAPLSFCEDIHAEINRMRLPLER